jgi:hypothetical protein
MSTQNETYNNIRTATHFARQRILLDYVIRYPGHSQNQVASGVRRYMTRRVAIKHLKDMATEGIITEQKAENGAAYGYYAKFNNPLVKVFQEVYEFEPAMCALVRKAVSQMEFRYWESPDGYMYQDVLNMRKRFRPIFELFKYFVDFYLCRATVEWHHEIAHEETRRKLYIFSIEAIVRIQEAMYEELKKAGMDRITIGMLFASAWSALDNEKFLANLAKQLEKIGLKKEGLDVIEKMPKRLIKPKIIRSYQNIGGKVKLIEKKRLNEDGTITRLR